MLVSELQSTQDVFDYISHHLLTQGRQAMKAAIGCSYLGDEGLRCALGCLIPIEKYNVHFEGQPILHLLTGITGNELFDSMVVIDVCKDLQKVHDYSTPDRWQTSLTKIAAMRGLNGNVPKSYVRIGEGYQKREGVPV